MSPLVRGGSIDRRPFDGNRYPRRHRLARRRVKACCPVGLVELHYYYCWLEPGAAGKGPWNRRGGHPGAGAWNLFRVLPGSNSPFPESPPQRLSKKKKAVPMFGLSASWSGGTWEENLKTRGEES